MKVKPNKKDRGGNRPGAEENEQRKIIIERIAGEEGICPLCGGVLHYLDVRPDYLDWQCTQCGKYGSEGVDYEESNGRFDGFHYDISDGYLKLELIGSASKGVVNGIDYIELRLKDGRTVVTDIQNSFISSNEEHFCSELFGIRFRNPGCDSLFFLNVEELKESEISDLQWVDKHGRERHDPLLIDACILCSESSTFTLDLHYAPGNPLWAQIILSLPDNPDGQGLFDGNFWTDGVRILCRTEAQSNTVADFLTAMGIDAHTGRNTLAGKEQGGNESGYTNWYYISMD